MPVVTRFLAQVFLMVAVYPVAAKAAEFTSVTLAGGVTVEFAVVLPDGFTADKAWPGILAFPPGGQNKAMVNTGLGWWESEAQRRGYLVFSPAAPSSELFFLLIPESHPAMRRR